MVNDFVYSVRSLDLMFGLLNNERKGTQKYAHMQIFFGICKFCAYLLAYLRAMP